MTGHKDPLRVVCVRASAVAASQQNESTARAESLKGCLYSGQHMSDDGEVMLFLVMMAIVTLLGVMAYCGAALKTKRPAPC
jgi:hypothetical protein